MFTGIPLVLLEVRPRDHSSVSWAPWHGVTGSTPLLKKILAFCFVWKKIQHYAYKQKGKKKNKGEGAKCFCLFRRPQTKSKRRVSFNKLKEKDLSLIADLSAL